MTVVKLCREKRKRDPSQEMVDKLTAIIESHLAEMSKLQRANKLRKFKRFIKEFCDNNDR